MDHEVERLYDVETEPKQYAKHVRSIAQVCVCIALVKLASAVVIGLLLGASIGLGTWGGWVPIIRFGTDYETFALIVGWSSIATAVATVIGFFRFGYLGHYVLRCAAWVAGLWSLFLLIVADAVMNALGAHRIPSRFLVITTLICMAGLVAAFALLGRPDRRFVESLRKSFSTPHPTSVQFASSQNGVSPS